ncbi:MAG: H(+)-transporting ATPase [Clostridiales bacterium]|nr:H(+)-transporting ATPase [Clostridiales bacterium]
MKNKKTNWLSPARFLVLGFACVILMGMLLLLLPLSVNHGVKIGFIDAFFTSTSAVCVTGLVVVDTADTFSIFGRTIIALLIQIGGLGFHSIGVAFILLAGKEVNLKERVLIKEGLNLSNMQGIVKLIKSVILLTFVFEGVGMALGYIVFSKEFSPLTALGISAFHSVAAFNNSGFDIMGGFQSLTSYQDNMLLNMITAGLVIFGGLGFYVIKEIVNKRSWHDFSMNTKIVLVMSIILLAGGTLLIKFTNNMTWLGAFFHSASSRTAGFNTYNIGEFSTAGQFTLVMLMFIGASPGSTGGGVKTTTIFTLFKSMFSFATNKESTAFHRKIPNESILKAFMVTLLALLVVCVIVFLICIIEPQLQFSQVVFEVVSGFATVGLTTGITPQLSGLSKLLLCATMFIGRLGPLTMATVWIYKPKPHISFGSEHVSIG